MRHETQEILARTSVPSPPSFDCELPSDARAEMLKSRRPVILHRPLHQPPDRSGILKWAGAIALVAIILADVIGLFAIAQNACYAAARHAGYPTYPGT
jgi:hypothetical protein